MGHQEVLESMGKDVPDGILFDGFYWQGYPDTPYNREFVKRFLNRTGDPFVPGIAHHGYVVSMVLFDAIKKAKTIDTEKVIDVLENMTFDTPLAPGIKFRKIDHNSTIGEVFGVSK
jgi:ABC-type branched-subunit amino acid transport system substrate-binding protein